MVEVQEPPFVVSPIKVMDLSQSSKTFAKVLVFMEPPILTW